MRERKSRPLIDRFWPKVQKTESCWLWTGAKDLDGYGFLKRKDGKQLRAHRFIFEYVNNLTLLSHGHIMHICDNPSCVNPRHLALGNPALNAQDMIKKGRKKVFPGSSNGMAKLTEALATEIYHAPGVHADIGKRYNITQTVVSNIKAKRKWKHIHD